MRCLVLGHSGTAGFGLSSLAETWPVLFEKRLAAHGPGQWGVSSVPLHPVGSRAADYALSRVEASRPDLVVLSLNAYPCVVPVVSASVRQRFGRRAERLYNRTERVFERVSSRRGPGASAVNRVGRGLGRRLLGARPLATVDEVGNVYREILRRLASSEGVQVVVLAEAMFGEGVRNRVPSIEREATRLQGMVRPVAEEHRFLWCDATEWLAPDGGSSFWQSDDVHLSARGNTRYAEMLEASLQGRLPEPN